VVEEVEVEEEVVVVVEFFNHCKKDVTGGDAQVPWLLEEFRTTRKSLLLANPSLDPAASHMEAGDSVCVLPDICTQVRHLCLRVCPPGQLTACAMFPASVCVRAVLGPSCVLTACCV